MEGNNNNNNNNYNHNQSCDVCGFGGNGRCGKCGHYCGFGGRHVLRWILGILIITWIFCIGVRFGELKSALEANSPYVYSHMKYGGGMMFGSQGGYDGSVLFTQSAPAPTTVKQ